MAAAEVSTGGVPGASKSQGGDPGALGDQLADEIIRDLFCGAQERRVVRRLIGLDESVQRPCLAPRPGRVLGKPGERRLAQKRAGCRVEIGDLERAAVQAHEIVGHRGGVRRGHRRPVGLAAGLARPPLQRPKGHHAVDDDGELSKIETALPGADRPDGWIVETRHRIAGGYKRALVARVSGQAVGVAVAGPDDEANVGGVHPRDTRGLRRQRGWSRSPPRWTNTSTPSPDRAAKARRGKTRWSIPSRCSPDWSSSTFRSGRLRPDIRRLA